MKEERKKWVMPKFLPHKYDVKLVNEDKVRHSLFVVKNTQDARLFHMISYTQASRLFLLHLIIS